MNLNNIILAAHEYKVALAIPGVGTFMVQTLNNVSYDDQAENEIIYAVGSQYPIGNKQNAFKFSGKFTIQNGEMNQILTKAGLVSAIQIPDATLSITSIDGKFSRTHSGMCINTGGVDIKAKDKETPINCSWTAIEVR